MQKARLEQPRPVRVSLAYTANSRWRNRSGCPVGRARIVEFLMRKWARELDDRLIKEVWAWEGSRIGVRFAYEWHDAAGRWWRSYGNENWAFDAHGFMDERREHRRPRDRRSRAPVPLAFRPAARRSPGLERARRCSGRRRRPGRAVDFSARCARAHHRRALLPSRRRDQSRATSPISNRSASLARPLRFPRALSGPPNAALRSRSPRTRCVRRRRPAGPDGRRGCRPRHGPSRRDGPRRRA